MMRYRLDLTRQVSGQIILSGKFDYDVLRVNVDVRDSGGEQVNNCSVKS